MPQGNLLKTLSTKWKLLQATLLAATQPDKAAELQQSLMQEVRAAQQPLQSGRPQKQA